MKTVLVTGGGGFIGSNLVAKLNRLRYNVRVCDKRLRGEVLAVQQLEDSDLKDVSVIFHLAATARLGISLQMPGSVIDNNVGSTLHLLEHCRKNPQTSLIFVSSSSAKFADLTKNPYALSKAMGEQLVSLYRNTYGVKATTVRLFNVYGPGEADYGPNTTLVKQCKNRLLDGTGFIINGDGSIIRDYTHVDDVTDGLIKIYLELALNRPIYELGSGESNITVKAVVEEFRKGTQLPITFHDPRPGDPPLTCADPTLRPVAWDPKIRILDYIRKWKADGCPDD